MAWPDGSPAWPPPPSGGGLPVLELDPPTSTVPTGQYVIGGYHDFDGTDEGITFGALADLAFQSSDTFTVSVWVEGTNRLDNDLYVGRVYRTGALSTFNGWALFYQSNSIRIGFGKAGNNYLIKQTAALGSDLDGWRHILVVWDAGTVSFYVDGQSVGAGSDITFGSVAGISYTTEAASVGALAAQGGYYQYPQAQIAEVAIWGSDQSANVAEIYNYRARHDLMELASPPDLFYASLTSYGDNPDGTVNGVFEAVSGNDGTGVNMEAGDAVIPTVTTVTSTLTKTLDVATSTVTTTKLEGVPSGTTGTGTHFP